MTSFQQTRSVPSLPVRPGAARFPSRFRSVALETVLAVSAMAQEMSFIEHLEELRRRILWSVACVAVTFAVCWMFAGDLYDIASAPIRANPAVTLSVSRPQDIVTLKIKVTLVAS